MDTQYYDEVIQRIGRTSLDGFDDLLKRFVNKSPKKV